MGYLFWPLSLLYLCLVQLFIKIFFLTKSLNIFACSAGGGPGAGAGVSEVVPGGDRAPLHRPARLLLPQRDAPHAEASHHHHPAPGHPGDLQFMGFCPSNIMLFPE